MSSPSRISRRVARTLVLLSVGLLSVGFAPLAAGQGAAASLTVSATSATSGGMIQVAITNGPGNPQDWVALAAGGSPDASYLDWQYLNGSRTAPAAGISKATLSFKVPAAAGSYVFRLFANNTSAKLASSASFTVQAGTPAPSLTLGSPTAAPGGKVVVSVANGPGNKTDWVAMAAATAGDTGWLDWQYLNGTRSAPATGVKSATLTFKAPTAPGAYNFRLFANNTYTKLATSATLAVQATPTPTPSPSPGVPIIAGCAVFPADNPWNRDVSQDPVDPNSANYIANMAPTTKLHPDFGSNPSYGIPWTSVPGTQPRVPMTFDYAGESDPGPYPFPPNAPVEAGGDAHVLVLDRGACKLYETWNSHFLNPGWHCGSGAIFDLRSDVLRPDGWTSADAAGLPILPGLVRRDEVLAGEIRHALRFTMHTTQRAYVHPATHFASSNTSPNVPPMGLRVRLKASFDVSGFTGNARVILTALKKYGMFLADNGSNWYITGETNTAWNDTDLNQLKTVPGNAFEVVKLGTIHH